MLRSSFDFGYPLMYIPQAMTEHEAGGRGSSRLIERADRLVLGVLIGRYGGNIGLTPVVRENMSVLALVPRYRLFHGRISGCYVQLSQGSDAAANRDRIILTCFGTDETQVNSTLDEILDKTRIEEAGTLEEVKSLMRRAKLAAAAGAVPEHLRQF